jgi:TonB-linked SusC/RagA family outer membrane protein
MYKIYAKNGEFAKTDTSPHSFPQAVRLYVYKHPEFKKWLMRIHVTFILLIAAFLQISLASNAQNISLVKKDISLTELFKEIKKQSGYDFVYTHDLLGKGTSVDIDVKNQPLKKVLDKSFENQPFTYSIENKTVVVSPIKGIPSSAHLLAPKSQQNEIKGVVTDAKGEPLAGASVKVKATQIAVITDANGTFVLRDVSANDVLVVSFIGFQNEEVAIGSKNQFRILLSETPAALSEVVVVGYGTQKRELVTSAIGSFKMKDEDVRQVTSPARMLEGKIAGVNLSIGSGNLAAAERVVIRGTSSISAGNNPLYVIDGVPINNTNMSIFDFGENYSPLATLNHADIESIEVLKDAASAAIYGSRASNGVILINTKSGKNGRTIVKADITTGFSEFANKNKLKIANSDMYVAQFNEGQSNYNQQYGLSVGDANYKIPISNPFQGMPDTDWMDLILQNGYFKNINTNFSGGNTKTQYYFGLGYTDQEGVIKDNSIKKYNVNTKFSHKFTDWLEIGANNMGNYIRNNQIPGANLGSTIIARAIEQRPFDRPFKPNGDYYVGGTDELVRHNPAQILNEQDSYLDNFRFLGTYYGKIDFSKHLSFKSSFSADIGYTYDYTYYNEKHPYGTGVGRLVDANRLIQNYLTENVVNYNNTFGKFSLNGLLGHSFQKLHSRNSTIDARGFPSPSLAVVSVASEFFDASGAPGEYALESYFGRATLSYDDKYIFTGTLRADGSSKFRADNRWGYFPSVSFGWNVSKEDFMQGTELDLKLRTSYGKTGNQEGIGNYAYQAMLSGGQNYGGASGISVSTFGNSDLTWEKADQFDIGFDLALFKRRLHLSFDAYYKKTTDLLYSMPIHSTTGVTSIISNIGSMENKGVEFTAETSFKLGPVNWSSNFNIAHNKNKILSLIDNEDKPIAIGENRALQVGRDIGSYYLFESKGIYQYDGEVPQALFDLGVRAGDVRWNDLDGNNVINDNDRVVVGSSNPKFSGGWSNSFKYKRLQLDVLTTFSYGANIYSQWKPNGLGRIGYRFAQVEEYYVNRWTGPGTTNVYPRAISSETFNTRNSTRFLEDASFIRLRALTLGYVLPEIPQLKLKQVRLFAQVDNLHLWTKYSGWDPEVNTNLDPRFSGADALNNPQPRTFSIGANISF